MNGYSSCLASCSSDCDYATLYDAVELVVVSVLGYENVSACALASGGDVPAE